jgi:hypothetical protein
MAFGFPASGTSGLVVMVGGLKVLGTIQFADELRRIVNENRHMLRTNPQLIAPI